MRVSQNPDILNLMCCIPVENSFHGSERMEFPQTNALCIYNREPYEETTTAIRSLSKYIKGNNIKTTGAFRSIYLEGAPNRGENNAEYITQIAVPVMNR